MSDTVEDAVIGDIPLQLQQLMLSTDPVLTSKDSNDTSDDFIEQLAPIVKGALQNGQEGELIEKLDGLLRFKDREIEAICNSDNNEYISSVERLEIISADAKDMFRKIDAMSNRIQKSGSSLAQQKQALLDARRAHTNVTSAIDAVSACLQALDLTNNVHGLLKEKQEFAALQTLNDLSNIHLKEVSDFGFAQIIERSVPALMLMIRQETVTNIHGWLREVRQLNESVGVETFNRLRRQRELWKEIVAANPNLKRYNFNSPVELAYRDSEEDYLQTLDLKLDFSPLYECVMVHYNIGKLSEFQTIYQSERVEQTNLFLKQDISLKNATTGVESLGNFERLLLAVTGFSIIDRFVSRNVPSLLSRKDVDSLWMSTSQKLCPMLTTQIKSITQLSTLKGLKSCIGNFLHALQSFEFDVTPIEEVMTTLLTQYSNHFINEFSGFFNKQMEKNLYSPITINDNNTFHKVLAVSGYKPTQEELDAPFPKTLPFSELYYRCCHELFKIVDYHQSFFEELQRDSKRIEDILKNAVDNLLRNIIITSFTKRLAIASRDEVVQTIIDVENYQVTTSLIEQKLTDERVSGRTGKVHLEASDGFSQLRKVAEDRLFSIINKQVDGFLGLAEYDWRTKVQEKSQSSYLQDALSFLTTMFESTLASLPATIKSFVYLDAFDHLASSMLKFLLEAPNSMTLEAAQNFDVDVRYLEQFLQALADSLNDQSITTTVMELRQSVNLLRSDNFEAYNDPQIRMKNYDRVKPETAKILVSKISRARFEQEQQNLRTSGDTSPTTPKSPGSPRSTSAGNRIRQYYQRGFEKRNSGPFS